MENFEKTEVVSNDGTSKVENLLKRAFMFLGEGKYGEADSYAEKVLDIDTENADAYLCKLLAELKLREPKELDRCDVDFSKSANYLKAHGFGDEKRRRILEAYLKRAAAFAAVEKGEDIVEGLKDCQQTVRYTELDLNRKIKKGKTIGAIYMVAFAMLMAGITLFVLWATSVIEFTAAAPVLLVGGIPLCFIMFIFVCKSYYDLIAGIVVDDWDLLIKIAIYVVTLFGGLGVWGVVMSVKLLKNKKMDGSTSNGLYENIETAEYHLKELKKTAQTADAALREFLKHESF